MKNIKIKDLPKSQMISKEQMKKVTGGDYLSDLQEEVDGEGLIKKIIRDKQEQYGVTVELMSDLSKVVFNTSMSAVSNIDA